MACMLTLAACMPTHRTHVYAHVHVNMLHVDAQHTYIRVQLYSRLSVTALRHPHPPSVRAPQPAFVPCSYLTKTSIWPPTMMLPRDLACQSAIDSSAAATPPNPGRPTPLFASCHSLSLCLSPHLASCSLNPGASCSRESGLKLGLGLGLGLGLW